VKDSVKGLRTLYNTYGFQVSYGDIQTSGTDSETKNIPKKQDNFS